MPNLGDMFGDILQPAKEIAEQRIKSAGSYSVALIRDIFRAQRRQLPKNQQEFAKFLDKAIQNLEYFNTLEDQWNKLNDILSEFQKRAAQLKKDTTLSALGRLVGIVSEPGKLQEVSEQYVRLNAALDRAQLQPAAALAREIFARVPVQKEQRFEEAQVKNAYLSLVQQLGGKKQVEGLYKDLISKTQEAIKGFLTSKDEAQFLSQFGASSFEDLESAVSKLLPEKLAGAEKAVFQSIQEVYSDLKEAISHPGYKVLEDLALHPEALEALENPAKVLATMIPTRSTSVVQAAMRSKELTGLAVDYHLKKIAPFYLDTERAKKAIENNVARYVLDAYASLKYHFYGTPQEPELSLQWIRVAEDLGFKPTKVSKADYEKMVNYFEEYEKQIQLRDNFSVQSIIKLAGFTRGEKPDYATFYHVKSSLESEILEYFKKNKLPSVNIRVLEKAYNVGGIAKNIAGPQAEEFETFYKAQAGQISAQKFIEKFTSSENVLSKIRNHINSLTSIVQTHYYLMDYDVNKVLDKKNIKPVAAVLGPILFQENVPDEIAKESINNILTVIRNISLTHEGEKVIDAAGLVSEEFLGIFRNIATSEKFGFKTAEEALKFLRENANLMATTPGGKTVKEFAQKILGQLKEAATEMKKDMEVVTPATEYKILSHFFAPEALWGVEGEFIKNFVEEYSKNYSLLENFFGSQLPEIGELTAARAFKTGQPLITRNVLENVSDYREMLPRHLRDIFDIYTFFSNRKEQLLERYKAMISSPEELAKYMDEIQLGDEASAEFFAKRRFMEKTASLLSYRGEETFAFAIEFPGFSDIGTPSLSDLKSRLRNIVSPSKAESTLASIRIPVGFMSTVIDTSKLYVEAETNLQKEFVIDVYRQLYNQAKQNRKRVIEGEEKIVDYWNILYQTFSEAQKSAKVEKAEDLFTPQHVEHIETQLQSFFAKTRHKNFEKIYSVYLPQYRVRVRIAGRESLDMISLSSPNRVGKLIAFRGRLPASPFQMLANPAALITSGERATTTMWRFSPYLHVDYENLASKLGAYRSFLTSLTKGLLETPYGKEIQAPLLVPTVFLDKDTETTKKLLTSIMIASGSPMIPTLEGDAIYLAREMLESQKMSSFIGLGIKEEDMPKILKLSGIAREKGISPYAFKWSKQQLVARLTVEREGKLQELEIPILAVMGSQGKRENKAAVLGLSAARLYKALRESGLGTLHLGKAGDQSKNMIDTLVYGTKPLDYRELAESATDLLTNAARGKIVLKFGGEEFELGSATVGIQKFFVDVAQSYESKLQGMSVRYAQALPLLQYEGLEQLSKAWAVADISQLENALSSEGNIKDVQQTLNLIMASEALPSLDIYKTSIDYWRALFGKIEAGKTSARTLFHNYYDLLIRKYAGEIPNLEKVLDPRKQYQIFNALRYGLGGFLIKHKMLTSENKFYQQAVKFLTGYEANKTFISTVAQPFQNVLEKAYESLPLGQQKEFLQNLLGAFKHTFEVTDYKTASSSVFRVLQKPLYASEAALAYLEETKYRGGVQTQYLNKILEKSLHYYVGPDTEKILAVLSQPETATKLEKLGKRLPNTAEYLNIIKDVMERTQTTPEEKQFIGKVIASWHEINKLREEIREAAQTTGSIKGMDIIPKPLAEKLLDLTNKEIYLPMLPEFARIASVFDKGQIVKAGSFSFLRFQIPLLVNPIQAEGKIFYSTTTGTRNFFTAFGEILPSLFIESFRGYRLGMPTEKYVGALETFVSAFSEFRSGVTKRFRNTLVKMSGSAISARHATLGQEVPGVTIPIRQLKRMLANPRELSKVATQMYLLDTDESGNFIVDIHPRAAQFIHKDELKHFFRTHFGIEPSIRIAEDMESKVRTQLAYFIQQHEMARKTAIKKFKEYLAGDLSYEQLVSSVLGPSLQTKSSFKTKGLPEFNFSVPELWGLTLRQPVLGYAPFTRVVQQTEADVIGVNKILAELIGGDDDGDLVKFAPSLFILKNARMRLENKFAQQTGKELVYRFYWESGVVSGAFASKVFGKHIISPNPEDYGKIVEELPSIQTYRKIRNLNTKRI